MHGSNWKIEYIESVVKDDISNLPKAAKNILKKAIEERLVIDPVGFGKPLRYSLKGHRRLRVGDYRIVYRLEPKEKLVITIAIKHRKDVYEQS